MDAKKLAAEIKQAMGSATDAAFAQKRRELEAKGDFQKVTLTMSETFVLITAMANNLAAGLADRTVDDTGCIGDDELADAFDMAARELRKASRDADYKRLLALRASTQDHLDGLAEVARGLVRQIQNATVPLQDLYEAFRKVTQQVAETSLTGMATVDDVRETLLGQCKATLADLQAMLQERKSLS